MQDKSNISDSSICIELYAIRMYLLLYLKKGLIITKYDFKLFAKKDENVKLANAVKQTITFSQMNVEMKMLIFENKIHVTYL